MEFKNNENKIYLERDGREVAVIEFEKTDNNTYNIYHTFVDDSLRGQGIAAKLVEEAVNYIESMGCQVTATCSYAAHWLDKNR